MSQFTSALEEYGLSHTEARVFEVGLKEGETDIAKLSRLLNLNRATTYHAIHQLALRGLLNKRIENGKMIVNMVRENLDETLFSYQENKLEESKETLRQFFKKIAPVRKKTQEPDVEYFTGFDGVRMAIEKAFRAKSRKWDIIAPKKNFFSEVDEEYADYYLRERKRRGIISRSLWEKTFTSAHSNSMLIKERQPRYLPASCTGKFHSVLILFDEHALFISSTKEMQATLLNSKDAYSMLQMQFDALWEISNPLKN